MKEVRDLLLSAERESCQMFSLSFSRSGAGHAPVRVLFWDISLRIEARDCADLRYMLLSKKCRGAEGPFFFF